MTSCSAFLNASSTPHLGACTRIVLQAEARHAKAAQVQTLTHVSIQYHHPTAPLRPAPYRVGQ
jgi:hypothetical protein